MTHAAESQRVHVPLGDRSYDIVVQSDQWDAIPKLLRLTLADLSHAMVIADSAVLDRWAAPIATQLQPLVKCQTLEIPAGESSKSVEQLERIWQWMHDQGADRRTVVIAVGGGVVGDLAGFAAGTYARGIRFVQIPTTLLAQVDSSVGGKTGINLPHGKNMVGAFWQPSLVVIDSAVLSSLPERTYLSGIGEIIKYGVIEDANFFGWLEAHAAELVRREPTAVRYAVARSCQIKADVVADDERETSGRRAILNYGHTFAHAIEATAGYGKFLHGEAVAIGMTMAARLALALGRVDDAFVARQTALIKACGLPTEWAGADPEAMLAAMRTDKKVAHATLRFILPDRIGHVDLLPIHDMAAVKAAMH